jgi:hypothetical protein
VSQNSFDAETHKSEGKKPNMVSTRSQTGGRKGGRKGGRRQRGVKNLAKHRFGGRRRGKKGAGIMSVLGTIGRFGKKILGRVNWKKRAADVIGDAIRGPSSRPSERPRRRWPRRRKNRSVLGSRLRPAVMPTRG